MQPLKFVIFEGNNSNIVRRVMQSRLACNMPQVEAQSPKLQSTAAETTGDERTGSQMANYGANEGKLLNYTSW